MNVNNFLKDRLNKILEKTKKIEKELKEKGETQKKEENKNK